MSAAAERHQVVQQLEKIGFSSYEARAYVALLEAQPANGYDLARASGIPASKIYETLQRLVAKGVALASAQEPTVYQARPPAELIADFRQETERSLTFLLNALPQLASEPSPGVVWRLRGGKNVLRHLLGVVNGASREVYLSIWPSEAAQLVETVAEGRRRGIRFWIASFGPCPIRGDDIYDLLSCGESSAARLGRRLTAAVADSRQTLIAEIDGDRDATGTLADDPSLALAVKEYIIHDLINHALIEEMGLDRFDKLRSQHPVLSSLLGTGRDGGSRESAVEEES